MTQKEYIIPLAFDSKSFSLFNKSLPANQLSPIREGISSLEQSVSIRPRVMIDRSAAALMLVIMCTVKIILVFWYCTGGPKIGTIVLYALTTLNINRFSKRHYVRKKVMPKFKSLWHTLSECSQFAVNYSVIHVGNISINRLSAVLDYKPISLRQILKNHDFSIGFVQRESIGAEPDVESVLSAGFAQATHDGKLDGGRVERRCPHPRPNRRLQRNALRVR